MLRRNHTPLRCTCWPTAQLTNALCKLHDTHRFKYTKKQDCVARMRHYTCISDIATLRRGNEALRLHPVRVQHYVAGMRHYACIPFACNTTLLGCGTTPASQKYYNTKLRECGTTPAFLSKLGVIHMLGNGRAGLRNAITTTQTKCARCCRWPPDAILELGV